MDIFEIVKLVDGGLTVVVLLFVFQQLRLDVQRNLDVLYKLIDKLTNHKDP